MASASSRRNKASIHAVIGASGSGKTSHVMAEIKRLKPARLLVWDTKGEFAKEGYGKPVRSIAELSRLVVAAGERGKFALAFQPAGDDKRMKTDFSRLCLIAFHAKNLTLVAEELAETTGPNWAPEGWRKATTQGRSEGLTVYGMSQAPAWVDKYFFGNCSTVRTGRLVFEEHAKTMARALGVTVQEVQSLEDGQYIHLHISPRQLEKGRIF